MKLEELEVLFQAHNDEFLKFDRVGSPRHSRPDLAGFLLLDSILPSGRDMIFGSEHDEYYLDPDPEAVAEVITEAQIIDLLRCGIRFNGSSFCVFA